MCVEFNNVLNLGELCLCVCSHLFKVYFCELLSIVLIPKKFFPGFTDINLSPSLTCVSVQLAFKYLGMVLFPLFLGYAVYSLLYHEHKGWYSFILNMTYGFLLTFGEFIVCTLHFWLLYQHRLSVYMRLISVLISRMQ